MKKSYLLGLFAGAALAITASADIIPTFASITPSGTNFTWNYSASVTNDEQLQTGNYFTIYDFSNIAPTTFATPVGWTASTSLVGQTPALTNPTDNASFYNVTFTYMGAATVIGPSGLGTFSINSNTNQLTNGFFAAEAIRSSGPNAGTPVDNAGRVVVPVPEMSALAPLIGVCGFGAIGVVTSVLRRRQKQG